ncbi:MAG: hypothetical protein FRX48_02756 [Lasallia pustulata]|uniref:Uncharacterized protein n=1 Tax=Lasallia pustulata TaxID=136370 RepID=A0A5M8PWC1_9LECA|nr:MAG: hypothetical protein FRX48_02756 [Lasallia pustulata]
MHFTALSAIAALAISSAPSLAVPLVTNTTPSRALTPRSQFCYNAPNVIAGTLLNRRTFAPNALINGEGALPVSRQTWCATGTSTYIVVTYVHDLPAPFPQILISNAQEQVDTTILEGGDSVIPGGEYSLQRRGWRWCFGMRIIISVRGGWLGRR